MKTTAVQDAFRALGDPGIAEHSARFFKTGAGQYGEGDQFLGIRVPVTRAFARTHRNVTVGDTVKLLQSHYHEERLLALILLVNRFAGAGEEQRHEIYDRYLENTRYINGWDLVDTSAHPIVGGYLLHRDRGVLLELARSPSLWERRIAIISTFHFIRKDQYDDTLRVSAILREDREDLIHKAVGWMLREVGKRDRQVEEAFLAQHYRSMPRTMLRYAIEKFSPRERQLYLDGDK